MKLLLWNVNGLRSIVRRKITDGSFVKFIYKYDIIILNETKINDDGIEEYKDKIIPEGFEIFNAHSAKRGYAGVSILTRYKPLRRIEPSIDDDEGRIVILEFKKFILIGVYVPNAGQKSVETRMPRRINYRTREWDPQFQQMCANLAKQKPIIVMGDMNVAAAEIDIHNPAQNTNHAGFTNAERHNFHLLLDGTQLIDTWRDQHPNKIAYTYFDYRTKARKRNAGWRIDYALVSTALRSYIGKSSILSDVEGSDHVPIELIIALS